MNLKKKILNNLPAKLISLVFAFATWFYVFDLIDSDPFAFRRETSADVFEKFHFEVKKIPVRPFLYGRPPSGYRVQFDRIKIDPEVIAVFGPREVLSQIDEIRTEGIDLSQYTRSRHFKLGLRSDVRYLRMEERVVDVYVPIEAVGSDFSGK